jgi:hypothetical protein
MNRSKPAHKLSPEYLAALPAEDFERLWDWSRHDPQLPDDARRNLERERRRRRCETEPLQFERRAWRVGDDDGGQDAA